MYSNYYCGIKITKLKAVSETLFILMLKMWSICDVRRLAVMHCFMAVQVLVYFEYVFKIYKMFLR